MSSMPGLVCGQKSGWLPRILFWIYYQFDPLVRSYHKKYAYAPGVDALPDSPRDAFGELYKQKEELYREIKKIGFKEMGLDLQNLIDNVPELGVYMSRIRRGVKRSYLSLEENRGLTRTIVDDAFISSLEKRAREVGISEIGFCQVPRSLIFRDCKILYPNAIVCTQEMKRSEMETAPETGAQLETLRVYANLGRAMNELGDWMRDQGVAAQVGHPYRGVVVYPPLAGDANLGYRGRTGLLITPRFGMRQRIGAIFTSIENLPLPERNEHEWVLDYCDTCNLCVRECPGDAILDKSVINRDGVYTSIDKTKCFPWFFLKGGCSICVKVCPFSRESYERIKSARERTA